MQVDPGELNKKIQIILRTNSGQDDAGFETEKTETETLIRKCWAKVTNTSGKELIEAGRELAETKKRFLVRYTKTPITTQMIIKYDGDEYDIQYAHRFNDDKEYLEIWTELRTV